MPNNEKYIFVEYKSVFNNKISTVLQNATRIKFNCFDVSERFVVFGANTGGIYIFTREKGDFVKLIPTKHGSIKIVAISENEKNLACATVTGSVFILEECFLDDEISVFNNKISTVLQNATRIKFNCFDVSERFVVFGANTGGIYIFTREKGDFVKLIPTKHGSIKIVAISENEKNLACATVTGSVFILEECFLDDEISHNIYVNPNLQVITAMKWSGNEVYYGDADGKVHVIVLRTFLGKSIFYSDPTTIMYLENPIIQIDVHLKLLLISTTTRTVLCDTEAEHFRKIGSKPHQGTFGACFRSKESIKEKVQLMKERRIFRTLNPNELLENDFEYLNIFCARPKVRLWEADSHGDVKQTIIFSPNTTCSKPTEIIFIDDIKNLCHRLEMRQIITDEMVGPIFKFNTIFNVMNKFILTYDQFGFYLFCPEQPELILWSTYYTNIKKIKFYDNYLYIWHDKVQISVICLMTVEDIIMESFKRQQYLLCADLCLRFFDQVKECCEYSKKIQYVKGLSYYLKNEELLERLQPIFDWITNHAVKTPSLSKTHNQIVTVDNPFSGMDIHMIPNDLDDIFENNNDNPYQAFFPPDMEDRSVEISVGPKLEISITPQSDIEISPFDENDFTRQSPNDILLRQYERSDYLETKDYREYIESTSLNQIYDDLQNMIEYSRHKPDKDAIELWTKKTFFKIISKSEELQQLRSDIWDYIINTYLRFNCQADLTCSCNFPTSKASKTLPKFHPELSSIIFENTKDYNHFFKMLPYGYRYLLEKIDNNVDMRLNLSLIIQYSDLDLISKTLKMATYDDWDDACKLLAKLRRGYCLNCDVKMKQDDALLWKDFAILMVQSIDAKNANKILLRYAANIPNGELDQYFFQYSIVQTFTKAGFDVTPRLTTEPNGLKEETLKILENAAESKLSATAVGKKIIKPSSVDSKKDQDKKCNFCLMALTQSEHNKYKILACNHKYHIRCLRRIQNECILCE